jgi:hypothetical protein
MTKAARIAKAVGLFDFGVRVRNPTGQAFETQTAVL